MKVLWDTEEVSVDYATAMARFAAPQDVADAWIESYCGYPGVETPDGIVESVAPNGYALIRSF